MSVWTDLDEMQQRDLEANLKYALDSSGHTDIIQTILNLAEFMDHSEKVGLCSLELLYVENCSIALMVI